MPIPFILPSVKPSVVKLYGDLCYFFPELTHFYGYAGTPDHNTKRCLDAMVYDSSNKYVQQQGRANLPYSQRLALGDRVLAFLRKNADHYHLNGVIWNRHVYGFPGAGQTGNYRGPYNTARPYSLSAHDDHLHIDQDGRDFESLIPDTPYIWDGKSFPGAARFGDGAIGPWITYLGQRLVAHGWTGYSVGPGPEWGPADKAGVQWAQEQQGFTGADADGIPGQQTWAWLVADKVEVPVSHTITAVFANVLRRTDPDKNRKRWPARVGNIVKAILSAKPDVVLANELDSVTAADIASRLGSVWLYQRLKGIGVFWRSDVFDFTEGRNLEHYFSTKDNRYFFAVPVKRKKSGETIWLSTSHLENDGDTKTNGEAVRKVQATEIAAKSKGAGKWILGADFNSTTRSNGTNPVKPRVILAKAGWKFLTDQTGVANREYASHHGGLSKTPKGAWIDDLAWKGLTYVDGSLIRTDGTDASDHHFLSITLKFWQDALERAIRTLAQTFVALITAAGTGLLDSDWVGIASACGMAFVVALVSAIAFPPKSTEAVSARSNY